MSYPTNKPLPPGTYQWRLHITGPRANGRPGCWPCHGDYHVVPGDPRTSVEVLEELRVVCARHVGIPIRTAQAFNFELHN